MIEQFPTILSAPMDDVLRDLLEPRPRYPGNGTAHDGRALSHSPAAVHGWWLRALPHMQGP